MSSIIKSCLKENIHFGTIPFTKNKTLYQAGADILARTFGLEIEIKLENKTLNFEHDFIDFEYSATCFWKGQKLQTAYASCNSLEQKFHAHFAKFNAKTGKWTKLAGKSVFDIKNTIDQIAQKRAFVRVVRKVLSITGEFTQDLEDNNYATKEDKLSVYQNLYLTYEDFATGTTKKEKREQIKNKILKKIILEKGLPTNFHKWDKNDLEILDEEISQVEKYKKELENAT